MRKGSFLFRRVFRRFFWGKLLLGAWLFLTGFFHGFFPVFFSGGFQGFFHDGISESFSASFSESFSDGFTRGFLRIFLRSFSEGISSGISSGDFFVSPVWAQKGMFTLKIVDEETKRPIPCRVSIRNEKGIPRKAGEAPFWFDHFVMPGSVFLEWPLGTYPMEIERGLEYLPRKGHFVLNRFADDTKVETLKRFINLSEKGWWSGDLMATRDLEDIELLMLADDLHFVPLAESADKRFSEKQKRTEEKRREAERLRAGRTGDEGARSVEETADSGDTKARDMKERGTEKSKAERSGGKSRQKTKNDGKTDEVWFDSDRLFTTQNYLLRHPACRVGILRLPQALPFQKLRLEERQSAVPMLYAIRQKYPEVWIDIQDADSWDVPLMISLGLCDSFQLLGPHILKDQLLPENTNWKRLPTVKPAGKINVKAILEKEKPEKSALGSSASGEMADTSEETLDELRQDLFLRPSQCGFIEDSAPMNYRDERGRQQWTEEVYFHLLNTGHRIPPSAGSGSGTSPNCLGSNRVYVYVDPDEYAAKAERSGFQYEGANAGFNQEMWWSSLRAGRCVVTNGPLLQPWVEGYVPGETFVFPGGEGDVEKLNPAMTLTMQKKAQYVEIIRNGRVVASVPFRNYAESGRLPLLEIPEGGWFLIRVVADDPQTYHCVMSAPYYVEFGGKKWISKKSAQFFVNWEKKRIEILEKRGVFEEADGEKLRKLHEYALTYWESILKRGTE